METRHTPSLLSLRTSNKGQDAGKRKSLARALGSSSKVPMELLPFYARIAASLSQQFPEMGQAITVMTVQQFRGGLKHKDAQQRSLEPRMRTANYLCELAKFRIADASVLISLLQQMPR
jgi:regulator of nonsense transcripts 2